MFTADDYADLHHAVFDPRYPGYRPAVVESPHGDGKLDAQKRYAHVALNPYQHPSRIVQRFLDGCLMNAHRMALDVARSLGVPEAYTPKLEYGALRVLEYPVGAGGARHTDFDLFTLNLWRDQTDKMVQSNEYGQEDRGVHPVHMGELGELIGLGKATPHEVLPSDQVQRSIVYFAIPDWNAKLSLPRRTVQVTVREWLEERLARSRYDAPAVATR